MQIDPGRSQPRVGTLQPPRLQLWGVPTLWRSDGRLHHLERLEAALLARLLIDGPASRAEMAALLWPHVGALNARANLRQRLKRLRTAAGFDVLADGDALSVRPDLAHDLAAPEAVESADDLTAAVELLGAFDYSDSGQLQAWVESARERATAQRRAAISRRADQLEAANEIVAALRLAQRLMDIDALDEDAHRRAMRLHHARGDRAAALQAFRHCRELLLRELGAAPSDETVTLAARIEAGAVMPTAKPVAAPPLALSRPPRMVGRERELAAVAGGWQRAPVVALLGEAGIGKSRLLAEVCRQQPLALAIGARPGDAGVPFALLVRLLRALPLAGDDSMPPWVRQQLAHLLPELGQPAGPTLNMLRLRQALGWLLANLPVLRQGALVVDDLQFADAATLELLPTLLDTEAEPRLRWLLAARSAEIPPLLREAIEGGEPMRAAVVPVGPLSVQGVQALLASLALDGIDAAAMAEPLHRHTGGNPMFLLQTLLAMDGAHADAAPPSPQLALPLPGSVGGLIAKRLALLSAPAAELAQVAALAGQDFDARLAVHVLGRQPADLADAWRELEAAHVLRDEAFAHDLVFEATLRWVPPQRVADWRARIAAQLVASGGALPRIAAHWQAAGQWALAGQAFSDAAAHIRKHLRDFEEAALLEQAAACFVATGDSVSEADVCWRLHQTQWRRKDRPAMRAAVARLQTLREVSPQARWRALAAAGQLGFDERQDEAALQQVTEAQALAEALGDAGPALWLLSVQTHCSALLNRPQDLLDIGRRCQLAFDALPHDWYSIGAVQNMGSALEMCGHLAPAEAMLQRAQAAYTVWDDPAGVADVQCFLSLCAHQMGRIDDAAELMQRGRQTLAEINGGRAEVHTTDIYQGRYWRDQGRLSEALVLLEDGHRRTEEHGEINLHAGLCIELGLTYLALGQPHRVHALVARPRQVPKLQMQLEGLLLEAELARVEARPPLPFLEQAQALVPKCPRAQRYGWRVSTAQSAHQPPDEAVSLLQTVIDEAHAAQTWSHEGPARVRLIEALLRGERLAAAHEEATTLAGLLKLWPPMMLEAAEYHWTLVRCFEAAGDTAAVKDTLRSALQRINGLAARTVPAAFGDSFLNRNPCNRRLREAASQWLRS